MADGLGTPSGVVSDEDFRLDLAGLIAPQTSTLAVRTGVMWSPTSTALVTGTSATGTMTVNVLSHHWVTTRGTADGVYLGTKEASTTVTIAAAPGSNSRIDVVYSKQNDSSSTISPDGTLAELYGVVTGTAAASPTKPAIPTGAVELATVQIASGTTNTLGAGSTITNTAAQVVSRGAPIPVRSVTERNALTTYIGLPVRRLDDGGRVEHWTGSAWAAEGDVPVLASIAARNTYFSGNLRAGASALVAGNLHVYDGSAWHFSMSGYASGTTDANGFITWAHGAGQAPIGQSGSNPGRWFITIPPQATDAINNVLKLITWSSDATNLTLRAVRTDTSAYFGTQPVNVSWSADF